MNSHKLVHVEDFLSSEGLCLDVRSPSEFVHARIPGAVTMPLFTDEERKEVGTVYKKQGQKEAVFLGVQLVGPKLASYLQRTEQLSSQALRIYCWRGGMRSGFLSWFLQFTGFHTTCLKGGYKAFRRYALALLEKPYKFHVLGGLTGSGKTEKLQLMQANGQQVIDLESLACHRGSAFGAVGAQPSNEQFENEIAVRLAMMDIHKPIWVEDESRMIGGCMIPRPIFQKMRESPLYHIEAPLQERIQRIISLYGQGQEEALIQGVGKIQKKLGLQRSSLIITLIREGNLQEAVALLLEYYDKTYAFSMSRRKGEIRCHHSLNL